MPFTDSRIRNSIDAGLTAKGFKKGGEGADLAIGYQVTSAERRSYNTVNTGWGGGYGYGGYGWGGYGMSMGTSTTYENAWEEGSLMVGMFDRRTKNLVWTGTATAALDESRSPEQRQQLVDDAVTKMLEASAGQLTAGSVRHNAKPPAARVVAARSRPDSRDATDRTLCRPLDYFPLAASRRRRARSPAAGSGWCPRRSG